MRALHLQTITGSRHASATDGATRPAFIIISRRPAAWVVLGAGAAGGGLIGLASANSALLAMFAALLAPAGLVVLAAAAIPRRGPDAKRRRARPPADAADRAGSGSLARRVFACRGSLLVRIGCDGYAFALSNRRGEWSPSRPARHPAELAAAWAAVGVYLTDRVGLLRVAARLDLRSGALLELEDCRTLSLRILTLPELAASGLELLGGGGNDTF